MRDLRWSEMLFAGVAALALWHGHRQNAAVNELQQQRAAAQEQVRVIATRRSSLERDLQHYRALAEHSSFARPVTLQGLDLGGQHVGYDLSRLRRPLLLYSIDPECAACIRNLSFIQQLAAERPCDVEVVGIAVKKEEEIPALVRTHRLRFPVLRQGEGEAWDVLPISVSPAAALAGPGGKVHGWWIGEFSGTTRQEIAQRIETMCRNRR